MATWMTHFRIADCFFEALEEKGMDTARFIFANIAPDCGVLNEDRLSYTPSAEISHFGSIGKRDFKKFAVDFLADKTDVGKFSFYLGYYLHIRCDEEWVYRVFNPKYESALKDFDNGTDCVWAMKRDWYDLDKLFIKKNRDFRAFRVFSEIKEFPNIYFDFFPPQAYNAQLDRIRSFYLSPAENLEREYTYLTEDEMQRFVDETARDLREEVFGLL